MSKTFLARLLLSTLVLCSLISQPLLSKPDELVLSPTLQSMPPLSGEVSIKQVNSLPLPPSKKDLKRPPTSVEIYQHDEIPIGDRSPLLMVHGLRGEFRQGFRWEEVAQKFIEDSKFNKKYKIYYARFNTYSLLEAVEPSFKKAIHELYQSVGGKQITILALSLGGNLVQQSMEDFNVQTKVEKVMTLGTPYHGSPLFCYDWLRYSIIKNHDVPWVRADLCLSYKLYFQRHPNLLEDLRWDNSDKGIPQIGKFSTWFPFHVDGNLNVNRMSNDRIFEVNEHLKVDKKKFICYGGYLLTPYVTPHRSNKFWKALKWPWWFATCTLPYHMGFEHPVLCALNYEMGRMVVEDEGGKGLIFGSGRYGLNDGITPLVSALFLPSSSLAENPINREPDISKIRRNIDVRKARVFRQIDHITFVDGYRPARLPKEIRDELAPELGARTIFDWMKYDLLDLDEKLADVKS